MSNEKMAQLLKRQEEQRQELAAGVYVAWVALKEKETQQLAPNNGHFEHAPEETREQIQKERERFFTEWGSDGRLAALMDARQTADREKIVKQQETAHQIKNTLRDQGKDNDRGR